MGVAAFGAAGNKARDCWYAMMPSVDAVSNMMDSYACAVGLVIFWAVKSNLVSIFRSV